MTGTGTGAFSIGASIAERFPLLSEDDKIFENADEEGAVDAIAEPNPPPPAVTPSALAVVVLGNSDIAGPDNAPPGAVSSDPAVAFLRPLSTFPTGAAPSAIEEVAAVALEVALEAGDDSGGGGGSCGCATG